MIQYWEERNHLITATQLLIDYPALADVANSSPFTTQRFIAKWASECLPTGKNMTHWNLRSGGMCPFCTSENETTHHILQCKHPDALEIWNEAMNDLFKKSFGIHTCWYVQIALYAELNAWCHGLNAPTIEGYPTNLVTTILEQRQIGWKLFLEGNSFHQVAKKNE